MRILSLLILLISFGAGAQTTINTKVGPADQWSGEWNAVITLPSDYVDSPAKVYPTVIFFPGLGEIGTDINKLTSNGPHAYLKQGWNGQLGPDKAIIISLQPITQYPKEWQMAARIKTLKTNYRVDTNRIILTGLSHGGWCSTTFVSEATRPDLADWPAAIITVVGMVPDDNPYPGGFTKYAADGGRYLGFEQWRHDQRRTKEMVDFMNSVKPGSAIYIPTDYGSGTAQGTHCCWNIEYGGNGTQPQTYLLDGVQQTIYEWAGKQRRGVTIQPPPPPPPVKTLLCTIKVYTDGSTETTKP